MVGVEAAETLPGAATETETDGTAPPEGLLPETAHELLEADAAEEVRTAIAEEDLERGQRLGREERACLALADVAAEVAGLASPLHPKTIEDSQESVGAIEAIGELTSTS